MEKKKVKVRNPALHPHPAALPGIQVFNPDATEEGPQTGPGRVEWWGCLGVLGQLLADREGPAPLVLEA